MMVKIMMQNWFDISNPQIINGKKSNSNGKVINGGVEKLYDEEFPSSTISSPVYMNLSRKTSSKDMSCTSERFEEAGTRNVTSCLTTKSIDSSFMVLGISDANFLTNKNHNVVIGEPLKFSSNVEKKHSSKPMIHSEEEEIAFLRSLGWEESNEFGDNEGLTLQEILDFYDKYAKNCSYDRIFSKLWHQSMILSVEEHRVQDHMHM